MRNRATVILRRESWVGEERIVSLGTSTKREGPSALLRGRVVVDGIMYGADTPLQLSGLGLMFAGITIRWPAIHALGVFFTGRVQIREGHTLIRTGIYSRLRHPAYAGSLLAYLGLGLAFSNWWTLACSVLPYLAALGYRIPVEEAVLQETFGPAYAQYARTTKRIVPWVY